MAKPNEPVQDEPQDDGYTEEIRRNGFGLTPQERAFLRKDHEVMREHFSQLDAADMARKEMRERVPYEDFPAEIRRFAVETARRTFLPNRLEVSPPSPAISDEQARIIANLARERVKQEDGLRLDDAIHNALERVLNVGLEAKIMERRKLTAHDLASLELDLAMACSVLAEARKLLAETEEKSEQPF